MQSDEDKFYEKVIVPPFPRPRRESNLKSLNLQHSPAASCFDSHASSRLDENMAIIQQPASKSANKISLKNSSLFDNSSSSSAAAINRSQDEFAIGSFVPASNLSQGTYAQAAKHENNMQKQGHVLTGN